MGECLAGGSPSRRGSWWEGIQGRVFGVRGSQQERVQWEGIPAGGDPSRRRPSGRVSSGRGSRKEGVLTGRDPVGGCLVGGGPSRRGSLREEPRAKLPAALGSSTGNYPPLWSRASARPQSRSFRHAGRSLKTLLFCGDRKGSTEHLLEMCTRPSSAGNSPGRRMQL